MSEPQEPITDSQSEALSVLLEAIGDAVFCLLSDDEDEETAFTEDEAEILRSDLDDLSSIAFELFDPQILSTETAENGAKKFVIQMTIPEEKIFDLIQAKRAEWNDYDYDEDDDEEEEDE